MNSDSSQENRIKDALKLFIQLTPGHQQTILAMIETIALPQESPAVYREQDD